MITPQQAGTLNLMGSDFQNSECETILSNVIKQQRRANPEQWTPFTWDDYKAFCSHNVTETERDVLNAFVNGGKPAWNTSCYLEPGWFNFQDGAYSVGERTIEMLQRKFETGKF